MFFDKMLSKVGFVRKSVVGPLIGDHLLNLSMRQMLALGLGNTSVTHPYKQSVWVYACVNSIAENLGRVPFKLKKDAGTLEPDTIESGELYDLFQHPNPLMNCQIDLIKATFIFYLLRGEAFWILERDNITQIPKEIWTFDPIRFEPVFDKGTSMLVGWKYKGLKEVYFSVNEIIHFKMFNPYDDLRGLSPLEAAKLSVDQNYQAGIYNKAFFDNGATVGGYISVPEELSDESFNRLVKQFEDRHKGAGKAHKVAVVEGGGKFTPARMTQKDMEFIDGKKLTKDEILAIYKVNKVVLGDYSEIKCFHPNTEVLTDNGFKFVTEIKKGDKVATLNPDTGIAEFKPVTKVYAYDYDGIIHKQTGKKQKIAFCVTPEHKMFGRRIIGHDTKRKGECEFIPIKDIPKGKNFAVPRSAEWNDGKIIDFYDIRHRTFERKEYHNGSKQGLKDTRFPIIPWLKFLGWFISEGNYFSVGGKYEIGISQSNVKGRKQFKKDMKDFPYTITEYDRAFKLGGKDLYTYLMDNVGHYCDEKRIPSDIKKLHPSLLKHLFDSLMAGDGISFGKDSWRFSTTSHQLAEDVFEISIKLGYAPTLSGGRPGYYKDKEGKRKHCKPVWNVELRKKASKMNGRIYDVKKIHYKGKVHCFEVPPYHTVLTRYDGKIMWIGQSYEGIKSAHKAFWEECLMPKILYFEEVLWTKLFSNIGQRRGKGRIWGQFDLANVGPLLANYKEKVQIAKDMFFMGWPINHINKRLELGMKEVPWGDEWWVPGGYASVNTLRGKPSDKKPKEDEDEVVEDNLAKMKFYCEPLEVEFQNKFKKILFETRRRAIASSFSCKDWDSVVSDKEIMKLKQSLSDIYSVGINSGIEAIQSESGKVDVDEFGNDILSFRSTRASFVSNNFKLLLSNVVKYLSMNGSDDEKIREVFNLLSNKISVLAKGEAEVSFLYGRDLALRYVAKSLAPSLSIEWKDEMGDRILIG